MPRQSKESKFLSSHNNDWEQVAPARLSKKSEIKARLEQYVTANLAGEADWTRASDVPTEAEIGWIENGELRREDCVIPSVKLEGPYESKEKYLETQYKLMRTDGVYPLARCVDSFRSNPVARETNDYRLYEEVYITTVTVARDGAAFKLEFSGVAIGKTVRWAKSKRLRSGSLHLEVVPPHKPSIFVYIGHAHQIEIDPQQKWLMIECTQGYWEAYRHTLKALQRVRVESFPLQEYFVNVVPIIDAPEYLKKASIINVSDVAHGGEVSQLRELDVLGEWPEFEEKGAPQKNPMKITSDMDSSQIEALKRILTKRLAIIQGPPGTGKTFTSVAAIKVLLNNMKRNDPPIVIAAQTNHAVDQILRHISAFEPDFIRLGGQTTDLDVIKPRTLYEIKGAKKQPTSIGTRHACNARKAAANELERVLLPLQLSEPISADVFCQNALLSEGQRDSINDMKSAWAAEQAMSKMNLWCENKLVPVVHIDKHDPYTDEVAEEYENLDEQELEVPDIDDDKFEHLPGRKFNLSPGYFAERRSSGISDEEVIEVLAKHQNLQKVAGTYRPAIYDYLRRQLSTKIAEKVRIVGKRCQEAAAIAKIGRWETDYEFVSRARVIGLTTTGLSKYRGLLSVLDPKVVLIEEAAETLEPYTVAASFNTLEHLILVGDHQQLRANCSCADLSRPPFNFDVSLFERLVNNNLEFTRLNTQRRMRPEIRELIHHIYPDLQDHSSVLDRPSLGGLENDVHFFHHERPELEDESKSKTNEFEARIIVGFTKYLLWNNVFLDKITILTFYNGQKKMIRDTFRRHPLFSGYPIKVFTVDSYQGEENDVVLLSLVRNNSSNNIGFLENINRACVALSRARTGFYLFGNARILFECEHWRKVLNVLKDRQCLRSFLPLDCGVHDEQVDARDYNDLEPLNGGCDKDCSGELSCGHACPLKCHPSRECLVADCREPCTQILPCGHTCSAGCSQTCECHTCEEDVRKNSIVMHLNESGVEEPRYLRQLAQGSSSPIIAPEGTNQEMQQWPALLPSKNIEGPSKWAKFVEAQTNMTAVVEHRKPATLETVDGNIAPKIEKKFESEDASHFRSLVDLVETTIIAEPVNGGRQIRHTTFTYGNKNAAPNKKNSLI